MIAHAEERAKHLVPVVHGPQLGQDVMLAAKLLELEADHTYQRMKAAQAMESNPRVVGVPAGVIPMNGKG